LRGPKCNYTAVRDAGKRALMTILAQVSDVAAALATALSCLVSIFAGRTADTRRDPAPIMALVVLSKCCSARFVAETSGP